MSRFPCFNGEKENGLDIDLAYATRFFNTFPGIYRAPRNMKAFPSNKFTTERVQKVLRKKEVCGNSDFRVFCTLTYTV